MAALEYFAPGAQQAAEAAATAAGVQVHTGRDTVQGQPATPASTSAAPQDTYACSGATTTTTGVPSNTHTCTLSEQQLQQQQQRQQQQLEAARLYARAALLVTASVALPSATQAQVSPDSLVLPSTSKSNKSKQQQQQQLQQQQRRRGQGGSWSAAHGALDCSNAAAAAASNMFALPGLMPSFPLPTGVGFNFGGSPSDNPFAGLLGVLGMSAQTQLQPPVLTPPSSVAAPSSSTPLAQLADMWAVQQQQQQQQEGGGLPSVTFPTLAMQQPLLQQQQQQQQPGSFFSMLQPEQQAAMHQAPAQQQLQHSAQAASSAPGLLQQLLQSQAVGNLPAGQAPASNLAAFLQPP